MATKQICIFTETFFPEVGGGETQARALADDLSDKGYAVFVLTRRSSKELKRFEHIGSVEVHRLRPSGASHLKKWGLLFSGPIALLRLRKRFDVIIVSGFRVMGLGATVMARLLGKRCLLKADSLGEMSGEFFRAGLAKVGLSTRSIPVRAFLSVRNYFLKMADGFVSISSAVSDELVSAGIARNKVHYIPNGVDIERFRPAGDDEKVSLRRTIGISHTGPIVVYTGRLVAYKGLPELLRAWKQLTPVHDAKLLLVGSGGLDIHNCEDQLRAFVDNNELSQQVIFAGPQENVEDYLRASDIFVFPTRREAFGISLVEAMACGLPSISSDIGGVKDIIEDGINGVVVDPQDEQHIASAIDRLLGDSEFAARIGEAGRATAVGQFSAAAVVDRYVDVIQLVTGTSTSAPTHASS